jgi:hypothetical protein
MKSLGECPDLIHLDQHRVRNLLVDRPLHQLDVGNEDVVADYLNLVAKSLGEDLPAVPVVFGETILEGYQREILDQPREVVDDLLGCELTTV